jgi:hypothetical protein
MAKPTEFYFKDNIGQRLKRSPLVEAWLEIRWEIDIDENQPGIGRDKDFPFALGKFTKIGQNFLLRNRYLLATHPSI